MTLHEVIDTYRGSGLCVCVCVCLCEWMSGQTVFIFFNGQTATLYIFQGHKPVMNISIVKSHSLSDSSACTVF